MATSGDCPECGGRNTLKYAGFFSEKILEERWMCIKCNSIFDETDLAEIERKQNPK